MPLFKSISVANGLLSVWQITESSGELLSFFTPEELEETFFQDIQFEKRKTEWLAIRALLKQMIGPGFEISYTKAGKPLISHPLYHHISISHSRDFAAVFIHQNLSVGIDIEGMNRNYASVKKRFLSQSELEHVNESNLLQCLYWCAKEAIFKLVEEEGLDFRKHIQVFAFDPEMDTFSARFVHGDQERTYQLQYTTFNEHGLVWVCDNPPM
jgi:4'-phosphopantetheinyl transferase